MSDNQPAAASGEAGAEGERKTTPGLSTSARPGRRWRDRPWWPWVRRIATGAFFAIVAVLIFRYARQVEWSEVWGAVTALPATTLALAFALVAVSHATVSSFDLFGRRYTGHTISKRRTWLVNFISYAFNLNFGSLVGGVAFRFRQYGKLGLDNETIAKVTTLSMLTNWLGYFVLAGAVFAFAPLEPPAEWRLTAGQLRAIGSALLVLAAVYLGLCAFSSRREFSIRGHLIGLPPIRMALLQLVVSSANWALMGAIVHTLLQGAAAYPMVLVALLAAAVAGVITHVPAGLGVLEAVFIALLGATVPEPSLLGALLAYRALYYIVPLAAAVPLYLRSEARETQAPAQNRGAAATGRRASA